MDIEARYQQIIEQIAQGHRALVRFDSKELEQLVELLEQNPSRQVLCLVEHSAGLHPPFEMGLLKFLTTSNDTELLIFALNCARRHIIQSRQQRGIRLSYEFLESLKHLLHSRSPELVEWTLRTIEECSNQGVYFLREFDKLKPPPWKWFNRHHRATRELIELLERRWKKFEKS